MGLAQLDGILQDAEVGEKQRNLRQHGQAAAVHIHPFGLVEGHHLGVHLGPFGVGRLEVGVALLEGLDLGLNAHHLQRGLHRHEARGQHQQVEDGGGDDDRPAPVVDAGTKLVVQKAQGQVERLGDHRPPAELDERLERGPGGLAVGSGRVNGLEHGRLLGPGKEAQAGHAAGVAHGQAEHVGGLLLAVGVGGVARQLDRVVQRDHGRARGRAGQKGRGKVEVGDRRVVIRLVERGAVADLLGLDRVVLAVQRPGKLAVGKVHRLGLVAESARPGQQGAHRKAVALNLDLGRHHVACVEAEGLHHVQAVGGVAEAHRAGSLKNARGRGGAGDGDLIEGRIQLLGQIRLVGVQTERQAKGGGPGVDQVELQAAGVGVVLVLLAQQYPVLHLRALVGEDDLQIGVLHRGLRHHGGGDRRVGRGSLRRAGGQLRLAWLA